jgi:hypothetical protein
MIDYITLTIRNLNLACSNPIDSPLKIINFILAIFLLMCFVLEVIIGYCQINSVYLKDVSVQTTTEKAMMDFYFDGLDPESIGKS